MNFQTWDFSQGIMLTMKVAVLVCNYKLLASIWVFRGPAPSRAGKAHQNPVVWLIQHRRHVRAETSLLGVYCESCQTCWVSRNDCLSLSRARFWSPWEVKGKWDSMKPSEDARRGWSASKSCTLIWVNSDLPHTACKSMGRRVIGCFREHW